jgi:ribonuclease J
MGSMTDDFIERAAAAGPSVLVTEGTRVKEGASKAEIGERDVADRTARLLSKSKRLVFSSFRGNDLDRVVSFHEACQANGRRLVVSMKVAILLDKLAADKHLKLPRIGKDVSVYVRRKKKGAYDDSDYFAWERTFLDNGMTASDIRKKDSEVLLHLDQWCMPELIDIKPEKGGTYIHSTTEAFNEQGEQDEQVVRNWVEHYGFSYHQIHASGHAPMGRVADLVNRVGAKRVVPIHTERADLFASFTASQVTLARRGKAIPIA